MNARTWGALALIVICAVGAWVFWPTPPVSLAVIATPAPAVAAAPKVATPIKPGAVKARPARVKKSLPLPPAVASDQALAVIDSVLVEPGRQATLVTSLVDTETGETMTLAERQPSPWLAPGGTTRIWLGFGVKPVGPVVRGDVESVLFRVKEWEATARGTVDVPVNGGAPDWFGGVGIGREW